MGESPEKLYGLVEAKLHLFESFLDGVVTFFRKHPALNGKPPIVHSVRSRIKAKDSLVDKLSRKSASDPITTENLFSRITDIVGVRVLHLHQKQSSRIHECLMERIGSGDWVLAEKPKAYTWDPESRDFFSGLELEVLVKESFYTSVHYVVKPRVDSDLSCEIQVRTLFEEVWGEIDHQLNYPVESKSIACKEQLRVLARLVGAGSRLADAIFRIHESEKS